MTKTGVLQQLEISGLLAAMLIVAYGLYKLTRKLVSDDLGRG